MQTEVDRDQIQRVKAWLYRRIEAEEELDRLEERYHGLVLQAETATTSRLDGMPKGGGFDGDRVGGIVSHIEQLDRAIQAKVLESREIYNQIDRAAQLIKANRRRGWYYRKAVILMRYADCWPWPRVAEMIFGREGDFTDRRETYIRRVHRYHGEALAELVELLNVDELQGGSGGNVRGKETESRSANTGSGSSTGCP